MSDLYSNMVKLDYWSLDMALDTVTTYYMMTKHDSLDALTAHRSIYYEDTERQLLATIRKNKEFEYVPVYQELPVDYEGQAYVPDGSDLTCWLNSAKSKIKPKVFIDWCIENKIPVPVTFDDFSIAIDPENPADKGNVPGVESDDVKYPVIKDVKFEGLEKEKFADIKKYYGMLQQEESKWRRAIPIAAKIGLLFYERNLEKGTKRPEFIEKYKLEFDALLKNNTVAGVIYDSLPEEYRGGSGTSETVTNLDPIINAAALAGSMVGSKSARSTDGLRKSLIAERYDVPTDDVLLKIINAVQKLEAEDDD